MINIREEGGFLRRGLNITPIFNRERLSIAFGFYTRKKFWRVRFRAFIKPRIIFNSGANGGYDRFSNQNEWFF
jgi:hypothetical protein